MRAVILSLLLLAGCNRTTTQLLVVLDSDLAVPSELVAVTVKVSFGPVPGGEARFDLASAASLPASFGVAPRGDLNPLVRVEVTAIGPSGPLFTREVLTRFREKRVLRLPITLPRGCVTNPTAEACASQTIDAVSLSDVVAGEELSPRPALGLDGGPSSPSDAGPSDAGPSDASPSDVGPSDAGMHACQSTADCENSARCLDIPSFDACDQESASCVCHPPCDPFARVSGCASTDACYWFEYPGNLGACIPRGTGGRQNESCVALYANDRFLSDDCNGSENFVCVGTTSDDPTGTCARYCSRSSDVCAGLGNFTCTVDVDGFGVCTNLVRATDVGAACATTSCQNVCSDAVAYCSAPCPGDLDICGADEFCWFVPGESYRCLDGCTTLADCLVAGHICDNVAPPGETPVKFCRPPRCVSDATCTPGRCDLESGFCAR